MIREGSILPLSPRPWTRCWTAFVKAGAGAPFRHQEYFALQDRDTRWYLSAFGSGFSNLFFTYIKSCVSSAGFRKAGFTASTLPALFLDCFQKLRLDPSHNNLETGEQISCHQFDSILSSSSALNQHFENICTSYYLFKERNLDKYRSVTRRSEKAS